MRAVKRLRGAPGIVRLECGLGTPLYLDIRGKRVLRMLVVLQAPPLICVKINSDDPLVAIDLTRHTLLLLPSVSNGDGYAPYTRVHTWL